MGDAVGHGFRGNQFTGGKGGSTDASAAGSEHPHKAWHDVLDRILAEMSPGGSAVGMAVGNGTFQKGDKMSQLAGTPDVRLFEAEDQLHDLFTKRLDDNLPTEDIRQAHAAVVTEMRKRHLVYEPLLKSAMLNGTTVEDFCVMVKADYDPEKRQRFADKGVAMKDGSFPIANESDLHNAIALVQQAADPQEAMLHIINRAKLMGMDDRLPEHWSDPASMTPKPPVGGAGLMPGPAPMKPPAGAGGGGMTKATRQMVTENMVDGMRKALGSVADIDTSPGTDLVDDIDYAVLKAEDANRYTLGPVYIPNQYDAHDEWATVEDMEKSCWDYVRKSGGDRTIYLQHSPEPAGEWVGILAWPQEVHTQMYKSVDGVAKAEKVVFPAGTPYMGVIWSPWAWEEVKKGKITGFSIGGYARRVEAQIEQ